jgi:ABC-type multidrug transport system fused ATPase/permease subunit
MSSPDGSPASARRPLTSVRRLLRLLDDRERRQWRLLVLMSVTNAALEMLGALAIFSLVNVVTRPELAITTPVVRELRDAAGALSDDGFLVLLSVLVAAFYALKNGALLLESFLQARLANGAASRGAIRLLTTYLASPWAVVSQRSSVELIRNTTLSVDTAFRSVLLAALTMTSDAMVSLGMLAVLFASAPIVTPIVAAILGLVLLLVSRILNPRFDRWGAQSLELSEVALRDIQESLGGLREVKVLGHEDHFIRRYSRTRVSLASVFRRTATAMQAPRLALETTFVLVMVVIVALIAVEGRESTDIVPLLGLYAYAGLRLLPSLNRMNSAINNIRVGAAAVEQVVDDLAAEPPPPPPAPPQPVPLRERLELRGVTYRYPGLARDVLRDIDLVIERGTSLGIVGSSGAGKSTLADVLMGLLEPAAGAVLVDGADIAGSPGAWQRNVGYVPQFPFIGDDTMRRNIAFGVDDDTIDDARVLEVVGVAKLDGLLAEMPAGLDTRLGERGIRLSGGQRQRIAIARALYHEPDVLVFDEATSALDNRTEMEIAAAIADLAQSRTIIVIAHRITTIRVCERVVFLDDGRIVDVAPLEVLSARNERFRALITAGQEA